MMGRDVLLLTGLVSTGLMAGLFFGWAVSVIPGTMRTGDRNYVETMQEINLAIVNPWFVVPFILTPVALLAAAFGQLRAGDQRRALTLAAAAGLYVLGVLGVTVGGNIPLNNELAAFDLAAAADGAAARQRAAYEGPWNRWHTIRTVAAVAALAVTGLAALLDPEDA